MTAIDARATNRFRIGLMFAITSAFTFGMSGPLAKALMEAGWTPTAAVTARLAGGALAMAAFATYARPGWVKEAMAHRGTVIAYGLIPIAGAQLCYYNAVSHLSVGVALLLEYTAPILVVAWLWATTRRRPAALTLAGAALAVAGIMLVLDVFAGAHINSAGVAWGLAAAICAACYFMMSEKASSDGTGLSPITLAAAGLVVGALTVAGLGASGVMPLRFTAADAVVAGLTLPWYVPVIALALIPTAIAYTLGIMGIARLQPRFASLVGLSEVLFAVLIAWVMLGEAISVTQAVGGAVVLAGLALARQGDRSDQVAQANWPDVPPPPAERPIAHT
ncbi:EamA family transporter [Mycolicibacterium bacteremicum]|uniref:EamA family transporter n=1 Tax=Mycolicibacterium bacteremicum TaxID=564198 RepID=A0A1W9Z3C0_MYCBA|nr:DMT family transporter [Mycolicibacterium bacteremicum]MCV7431732.1 EamA family transporter [Mycolicibacterium bacteremicum]ORA06794.1 EamA family transporter [Mycolicibacterium bacteremicum]